MNVEEYERMYALEGSYWWFQGRLAIIRSVLEAHLPEPPRRGRVLDIGCGTGLMLDSVSGWEPIGLDFSQLALRFCRERGINRLLRADVVHLPIADNSIDLILALDMIEHVERDDLLIREFNRILRPGGLLLATVPAHPSLWSDHDVSLHHFRRYTQKSFRKLLRAGRFESLKDCYAIAFLHPGIVVFRHAQRLWQRLVRRNGRPRTHLIPLPGPVNRALIALLRLEAWLLRRVDLPLGTSLLVLARKAGPAASGEISRDAPAPAGSTSPTVPPRTEPAR